VRGEIHALSGAYAVDALDDDERALFEQHLAECETCRAEVASLQEAAALLGGTTATEPPAALRDQVLAGIATVRPLPPEVEKQAAVTDLAPRRRRRTTAWLAAAAAVVAIGGGAVVWEQTRGEPQDQFSAIADAPDARSYTAPVGDGGSATVVVSKKQNKAYIQTTDMPAAPAGKEYVLWLQHGTALSPAGVMPAGSSAKVLFDGDAATADGAAVSVEQAGTSPTHPSADVVATFPFT
jgi:anti-sigma-K factor RskA